MEAVLLFIFALALGKMFSKAELKLPEQVVCAGAIAICVLTYLVSLVPVVLWPLIIWVKR
jgi:hypothetical protein